MIKQTFFRYSFIWSMLVIYLANANDEELDTIDLKPGSYLIYLLIFFFN